MKWYKWKWSVDKNSMKKVTLYQFRRHEWAISVIKTWGELNIRRHKKQQKEEMLNKTTDSQYGWRRSEQVRLRIETLKLPDQITDVTNTDIILTSDALIISNLVFVLNIIVYCVNSIQFVWKMLLHCFIWVVFFYVYKLRCMHVFY